MASPISIPDIVWLAVWATLFVAFWLFQIWRYRRKALKDPAFDYSKPPRYFDKLLYEHYVFGILFVHPLDSYSRFYRIVVLLFNMALVLTLTSLQFTGGRCIEDAEVYWSTNFLVRVIQGSFTSMLLTFLFGFECVADKLRRPATFWNCCINRLCVFCVLLVVMPVLLAVCSDFYHDCSWRFVLLKWCVALALEYGVGQPVQVWVQIYLLWDYQVFQPKEYEPSEDEKTELMEGDKLRKKYTEDKPEEEQQEP